MNNLPGPGGHNHVFIEMCPPGCPAHILLATLAPPPLTWEALTADLDDTARRLDSLEEQGDFQGPLDQLQDDVSVDVADLGKRLDDMEARLAALENEGEET